MFLLGNTCKLTCRSICDIKHKTLPFICHVDTVSYFGWKKMSDGVDINRNFCTYLVMKHCYQVKWKFRFCWVLSLWFSWLFYGFARNLKTWVFTTFPLRSFHKRLILQLNEKKKKCIKYSVRAETDSLKIWYYSGDFIKRHLQVLHSPT